MTTRRPVSTVFCLRPTVGDVGDKLIYAAIRHRLREVFGPWVNPVTVPFADDGLGRGGICARTLYEFNLFGHGLIICGGAPSGAPRLDVDLDTLKRLELPLMLWGVGADLPHLEALAPRAITAIGRDAEAVTALHAAGVPHVTLGGSPSLFAERALRPPPAGSGAIGGALLVVSDLARLPIDRTRRAGFVSELRAMLRVLAFRYGEARLLCQTTADRHLAASMPDVDALYVESAHTWLDRLREAEMIVTMRAEAALACASLGRPFVHISDGAAGRAALTAANLQRWSVDLETTPDLAVALKKRLRALGALDQLRIQAMPHWGALDQSATKAVARFAEEVRAIRSADVHRKQAKRVFLPDQETTLEVTPSNQQREIWSKER